MIDCIKLVRTADGSEEQAYSIVIPLDKVYWFNGTSLKIVKNFGVGSAPSPQTLNADYLRIRLDTLQASWGTYDRGMTHLEEVLSLAPSKHD